eukprot:15866-Heterococcus_DN1.PRE.2
MSFSQITCMLRGAEGAMCAHTKLGSALALQQCVYLLVAVVSDRASFAPVTHTHRNATQHKLTHRLPGFESKQQHRSSLAAVRWKRPRAENAIGPTLRVEDPALLHTPLNTTKQHIMFAPKLLRGSASSLLRGPVSRSGLRIMSTLRDADPRQCTNEACSNAKSCTKRWSSTAASPATAAAAARSSAKDDYVTTGAVHFRVSDATAAFFHCSTLLLLSRRVCMQSIVDHSARRQRTIGH